MIEGRKMSDVTSFVNEWAELFGRLSRGSTTELDLIARNEDVAVGELFIIPSLRGSKRIFFFRAMDMENILRRVRDLGRVAGTLVVEGDSYLADLEQEKILRVTGKLLGYVSEDRKGEWVFERPRRLPEHLAMVYRTTPEKSAAHLKKLLDAQISGDVFLGQLLAGDAVLNVDVNLPKSGIPIHMGIFGTTGCGKSNFVLVLLKSVIDCNFRVRRKEKRSRISMLAIDPHDEFSLGIGKHGVQDMVEVLPEDARRELFHDFYYLTPFRQAAPKRIRRYAQEMRIAYSEILPVDIQSIVELSDQMMGYMHALEAKHRGEWISQAGEDKLGRPTGTLAAVQRRLEFVRGSHIFVEEAARSTLPRIVEALEEGRILIFNTSLLSDMEQFLTVTVIARTLFELRKALKSSTRWEEFRQQVEKRRLPKEFVERFVPQPAERFYVRGDGSTRDPADLPPILVTIEEAPSILTSGIMRFENIYKDIARQGRKFGIGLAVISQQLTVLDNVILSQLNTQINMALGNDEEIRAAVRNASEDISRFEREFRVLDKGEAIVTASYRDLPIVIKVPLFDDVFERDKDFYKQEVKATAKKDMEL
jgi:hypothetical protein